MSRPGSHKAGNAGRSEDKMISSIDRDARTKAWLDTLTPDEIIAFKIGWCLIPPYEGHSREWAEKKMRSASRCRFVGRMAARAFNMEDEDIHKEMDIIRFFVPAMPQKVELEAEVNQRNMNCNFTPEDLKDKDKLKDAYAAMFGEPPMIED